jgi:uncharacterized protein YjhX (UPF0386 family)
LENLPHGSHECKLIVKSIHSKPYRIRGLPVYLYQCIMKIQNYTFKTLFDRVLHKVVGAGGRYERKKTNQCATIENNRRDTGHALYVR